jgi:hypothetical protein
MNEGPRRFEFVDPATIIEPTALSIGLYALTGQGKTECSLRLAFGIRRVTGGRVFFADCDNGRGLHFVRGPKAMFPEAIYTDFKAPHNALDYVDLLEQMSREKDAILIIDNMSAEHEGEGGYLETKEAAMYDRDGKFKEGRTAVAWNIAKTGHKKLVRAFVKVNRTLPIIVTWRAGEKLDWSHKDERGKIQPESQGEMPIGSKDLPFEMTATYLLPAGSKGAPLLTPQAKGEQLMTKIPRWFEGIVKPGEKFREEHGEAMARWAFGASKPAPPGEKPYPRLWARVQAAQPADVDALATECKAAFEAKTITRGEAANLSKAIAARREALAGVVNPDAEPPAVQS